MRDEITRAALPRPSTEASLATSIVVAIHRTATIQTGAPRINHHTRPKGAPC